MQLTGAGCKAQSCAKAELLILLRAGQAHAHSQSWQQNSPAVWQAVLASRLGGCAAGEQQGGQDVVALQVPHDGLGSRQDARMRRLSRIALGDLDRGRLPHVPRQSVATACKLAVRPSPTKHAPCSRTPLLRPPFGRLQADGCARGWRARQSGMPVSAGSLLLLQGCAHKCRGRTDRRKSAGGSFWPCRSRMHCTPGVRGPPGCLSWSVLRGLLPALPVLGETCASSPAACAAPRPSTHGSSIGAWHSQQIHLLEQDTCCVGMGARSACDQSPTSSGWDQCWLCWGQQCQRSNMHCHR